MCLTEFPAVSNYHISPDILYPNEEINRCKKSSRICDLTFFTFFPAIYSTYNGSARKKSSRIFSCARVRIRFNEFSPSNICLYIIAAVRRGLGQAWRLELTMGISYLWWTQTWLKSAQMARHDYSAICAHNLFAVYHIDKLSADNRTLFDDGKMCERTQIFHVKMWWCKWIFI